MWHLRTEGQTIRRFRKALVDGEMGNICTATYYSTSAIERTRPHNHNLLGRIGPERGGGEMLLVNEANYRFLPYEFEAEGHFVDTNANPDLSPCSRKSAVFTNDTNTTHSAS